MKKAFLIIFSIICVAVALFWYSFWYTPCPRAVGADLLVVGTSADFQPFAFKDGDDIVGFDIDVIKEVAQRLHKKLDIKDMPFELLVPQVQLGTIQAIAAGLTITPERSERVIFTEPYFSEDPLIVISRVDHPITNDNLSGKKIIVNQGYTADFHLSKRPDIELTRLPTVSDAIMALQAKRADAFVTAESTFKPFIKQYGTSGFLISQLPGVDENYALAISRTNPELAQQIQSIVKDLIADGTIEKLKQKWHIQ